MTVEAVVAYFGIVLAGCAAVSIADSFAAAEIAMRLRISNAAAIVTQDVIGRGKKLHPLYARVVEADAPRAIVVPANASAGLQANLSTFVVLRNCRNVSRSPFLACSQICYILIVNEGLQSSPCVQAALLA